MIKRLNFGMVNAYLISGENGTVLVDTGYLSNREKLISMLDGENLKLIILTHGHGDHISNAKYISEKFDVPIAMHKDDLGLARDNTIHKLYADTISGYLLKRVSELSLKSRIDEFTPQIFLEDGMYLSKYGLPIKIIELKGHTAGSVGILVGEYDIIVGDTLMNFIKPSKAKIYENEQELMKSLNIIKETGVKTIHVGHGNSIDAKKFF